MLKNRLPYHGAETSNPKPLIGQVNSRQQAAERPTQPLEFWMAEYRPGWHKHSVILHCVDLQWDRRVFFNRRYSTHASFFFSFVEKNCFQKGATNLGKLEHKKGHHCRQRCLQLLLPLCVYIGCCHGAIFGKIIQEQPCIRRTCNVAVTLFLGHHIGFFFASFLVSSINHTICPVLITTMSRLGRVGNLPLNSLVHLVIQLLASDVNHEATEETHHSEGELRFPEPPLFDPGHTFAAVKTQGPKWVINQMWPYKLRDE